MRRACAIPIPILICLAVGCDVRSFWGDTFLEDETGCPGPECAPVPDAGEARCAGDGECPSGLCRIVEDDPYQVPVGACVPPAQVCLVDGDGCAMEQRDGTPAHPFCDPVEAAGCRYVRVLPRQRGQSYGPLTLATGMVTLVGPRRGPPPAAPGLGEAVLGGVEATGKAQVTLVGLMVRSPMRQAIRCSAGAQLSLFGVAAVESESGIYTEGCAQVVIDRCRVAGNSNDGVHIGLGTKEYLIVNSLITGNATEPNASAAGIYLDPSGQGRVAFSTVADNGQPGRDAGGVQCGTRGLISDSIVHRNGMDSARSSQFLGTCELQRVVVGQEDRVPSPGVIRQDPALSVDHRLTLASMSCIDKAQGLDRARLDHYGTRRPQRGGPDIGHHELLP